MAKNEEREDSLEELKSRIEKLNKQNEFLAEANARAGILLDDLEEKTRALEENVELKEIIKQLKQEEELVEQKNQLLAETNAKAGILMAELQEKNEELEKAQEEINTLALFPAQNPNPILRVSLEGSLIYANENSKYLLDQWQIKEGEKLPQEMLEYIKSAIEKNENKDIERTVGDKVYSLLIAPLGTENYVNVYGSDITQRKQVEEALRSIVQGISSSIGEEFFRSLVSKLSEAMNVGVAFIAGLTGSGLNKGRALAVCQNGELVENFEFDMYHSPCENLLEDKFCFYASKVQEKFPDCKMLKKFKAESFMGVPLFDSKNVPLGIIAVIDQDGIENDEFVESLLKIFAIRASTEIERLRVEGNLRREKEQAVELSKKAEAAAVAKTAFVANMSHEIRTPMNGILGFSDLLKELVQDENQKSYVEAISSSGQILLEIINDILDFSKLESKKVELEDIDFDLEYLVNDVFKLIKPKIKDKKIDLYMDIESNVPTNLKGDPTRIRQIFTNLIGNAVKFTPSGEIGVIAKLENPIHNKIVTLRLIVKDSGIGIPENKKMAIFDSFDQADTSTTRKFGGTGLGLAISKTLVEMMEGNIWAESDGESGSEFIFIVKLREGDDNTDKQIFPVSLKELKGKTIGVVDYSENTRKVIERYCNELGLKVLFLADSVNSALNQLNDLLAKKKIPDIILTYVVNHGEQGYDLLKQMRLTKKYDQTKMILMTADISLGGAKHAEEEGFDGFLPKPVVKSELFKVLVTMLGDQRKEKTIITRHLASEMLCKGIKVLVVEDNENNIGLLKTYFGLLGCEGDYAHNGQEAIEKLKKAQYDVCLMDLQMPVMGGIDATKIIRAELNNDIPIIALTAAAMEGDRERCIESGMNDYITKPVTKEDLKNKLIEYTKPFE